MIYRFGDYSLDTQNYELCRGDESVATEPQVFSLLVCLIERRDRVVSKDELIDRIWDGRIVSDATLSSRISAARHAVGDSGAGQKFIRTLPRRGFRFVAAVTTVDGPTEIILNDPPLGARIFQQQVRFCTASDGTRIAYATGGSGPPLIKTATWLSHLEFDWESPVWQPMLRAFAGSFSLTRYDERGNGLSDWDVDDFTLDAFVDDLEAVVAATKVEKFALYGQSQGAPVAIAYAARHPERITHLVLYGGFAQGARRRGTALDVEREEAITTLMREGWGQDNPAFRQIFTSQMMPEATAEQMQWFNDLQRKTTSPENAARLRIAIDEMDVSDLLPELRVKTLVIHRRNDARQPFEQGRLLGAMIPDARFVALEGANHVILEHEPEWPRFLMEIKAFLQERL